jgi:hypothetical protein
MKQRTKLSHEQQHATAHEAHETRSQAGHEFAGAEELLRFDAAQTIVPPEVELRLKQSAAALPPRRSWWKNMFGA